MTKIAPSHRRIEYPVKKMGRHATATAIMIGRSNVSAAAGTRKPAGATTAAGLALPDFPVHPEIKGVGLSDWDGYAIPLKHKLGYENTFYHPRESGGTRISSAYKVCADLIATEFPPSEWNLYCFQFSDGDNWGEDNEGCLRLLREALLPDCNLFCYGQVDSPYGSGDFIRVHEIDLDVLVVERAVRPDDRVASRLAGSDGRQRGEAVRGQPRGVEVEPHRVAILQTDAPVRDALTDQLGSLVAEELFGA